MFILYLVPFILACELLYWVTRPVKSRPLRDRLMIDHIDTFTGGAKK